MTSKSEVAAMLARLVALALCYCWLWPALARYGALHAARRPPAPAIRRRRYAAVVHIGQRLYGLEVRLVYARCL